MLILIAINALVGAKIDRDGKFLREDAIRFRYGSKLTLQVWIAITGVGFGLLAYGYSEAYVHLFDWWCSRQARSDVGLDYGRYLNTLSRSPVAYGVRGYPTFATLRYALTALTIAASISYKFGLLQGEAVEQKSLSFDEVAPSEVERMFGMMRHDFTPDQPWFTDRYGNANKCFLNRFEQNDELVTVPYEIMFARPFCPMALGWDRKKEGSIISRDIVILARKSEESDPGKFKMSRDDDDWIQAETLDSSWFGDESQDRAVVQYRSPGRGKLQIQWGKLGSWYTDTASNQSELVMERITYTAHYAVAEVGRELLLDGCTRIFSPTGNGLRYNPNPQEVDSDYFGTSILSVNDSATTNEIFNTHDGLKKHQFWINALVTAEDSMRFHGVSAIVRAFLNVTTVEDWGAGTRSIQTLSTEEQPFGPENDSQTIRATTYPFLNYPFYIGTNTDGVVGCHIAAAAVFLVLGVFSIVTMVLRIVAGPPEITSWAAQHLYLLQAGITSMDNGQESLSSGYSVAPAGLGRLKMGRHTLGQREKSSSESESLVCDNSARQSAVSAEQRD